MNIAEDLKKLGENIASSYDIRVSTVGDIIKDTHSTLKNFHTEHRHMANELRMDLAKVPKMLKEFMDNFLKAQNQFHNMLSSYYKEEIKQPTQKMLSEFRRDFDRAHEAWMSVSRSMSAKRGRKAISMERMNKAEQICSILKDCPQGMTPGMIAEKMGCTAQSLKTTLQGLKNQGRINKKQNKFFPK